jgi:hypothetical protein
VSNARKVVYAYLSLPNHVQVALAYKLGYRFRRPNSPELDHLKFMKWLRKTGKVEQFAREVCP